ncbi:hypothetical protein GOP47_0023161 [Adiantum capillus-veneris]|uniref:Pentatricopeptide repeat-containing protein n=1 Tax=Adiantum capillus-veneris TaxID=13818 RepID=A0A9D4U7V2_ADICA|nr:hypothetical protein GOP47_0023161 [Adiantum capillus-veneris]
MQKDSYEVVSSRTLIPLLKACAKRKDLKAGIKLHTNAAAQGLLKRDPFVGNTLVDMYAKCGILTKAQEVFDGLESRDVVSWTALIGGYAEQGHGEEALKHLDLMQCEGVFPNAITFVCSLKACGSLKAADKGQEIHAEAERKGFLERDLAVGNTLVDMYAKCGVLDRAQEVFDKLLFRDVISWTALIAGYVDHENGAQALTFFAQMQHEGVCPNAITFSSMLKACGIIGDINKGKQIHAQIEPMGTLGRDPFIGNALVDMYAKCGSPNTAHNVFSTLPTKNIAGWTALISGYADYGHDEEALQCFDRMQAEGVAPDSMSLASSLKACGNTRTLSKGQELHAEVERTGFLAKDTFIGITLINMYVRCGLLTKAREVFDNVQIQEVAAWTVIMAAYINHAFNEEALMWYDSMWLSGVLPNSVTFGHSLKACGNLRAIVKGKEIHAVIEKLGLFEGDLVICNALIEMYMKLRLFDEARKVFCELPLRNVASWNVLIAGYVEDGQTDYACNFLEQMQLEGVPPDSSTYVCSLKIYCSMGAIDKIDTVHSEIEKRGLLEANPLVGNILVDTYAKCGLLTTAAQVFKRLPTRDVVAWNILITGYCENGFGEDVLQNFEHMHLTNISPDSVTLVCGLKACVQVGDIMKAQELHAEIERQGLLEEDLVVGNSLVDMYGKFGLVGRAREVFLNLSEKDVVSWTALIAGYAENGHGQEALIIAEQMHVDGMDPNDITFICILKACVSAEVIDKGQEVHAEIERKGIFEKNVAVGNSLLDFYAKNGLLARAHEVFSRLPVQNALSWSTLIAGYTDNGHGEEALELFECMEVEGLFPDVHIFSCCLMACGMVGDIERGHNIHSDLERRGLFEEDTVTGNTLVDMYAKCDSLVSAQGVFDKLLSRDLVAWNALVTGYAEHGEGTNAIDLFEQMLVEGVIPNEVTFLGILKACSTAGSLEKGQEIHALLARLGLLDRNGVLGNTLVDMYAKCGALTKAKEVFDGIPLQNVVSWTALIGGYTELEYGKDALKCFEKMQFDHVPANSVTCICVLKAYGSIGALEKGREIHAEIEKKGLMEGDVIGNTLVHMYAKCGSLKDAHNVFDKLPVESVVSCNALIAGYARVGESVNVLDVFNKMLETGLRPSMATFVVVLNACSRSCLLDCCLSYFEVMSKENGVQVSVEHLSSIVSLLCRVGQTENALALTSKMPFPSNAAVWRSMLSICRESGNVRCGRQVYEQVLCLDRKDPSAYVLMSHIFAGANG